jgi:hypothetical protein
MEFYFFGSKKCPLSSAHDEPDGAHESHKAAPKQDLQGVDAMREFARRNGHEAKREQGS